MFKKPFQVKKNANIKGSEAKRLCAKLGEACQKSLDKKAVFAHVKGVTFNNHLVNIYTSDKTPLFFDFGATTYPTVYFLWKASSSFPMLVVHQPVLQYLENGADLMLQGVVRSFQGSCIPFTKGSPVGIALLIEDKLSPVAVGSALMSFDEMVSADFKGKGVQVMHVVRDTLWEFGPKDPAPFLEITEVFPVPDQRKTEQNEAVSGDDAAEVSNGDQCAEDVSELKITDEEEQPSENPDDLLLRCFLAAVKYRLTKKAILPFDVGQFYSQHLLACLPEGRRLDLKKTKSKKFGSFLTEINKHEAGPILKITPKGKGVDVISEVSWEHPLLRSFVPTDERIKDEEEQKPSKGPNIEEYFAVTENVVDFFNEILSTKKSKGILLDSRQVKEAITSYVKKENLGAGSSVSMDPVLANLVNTDKTTVDWNTLIQKIQAKMTKTFVVRWPDGREIVRRLKMPNIIFKVETRSGNKKVTLVNNLSVFGLDAKLLCHDIMIGAATSATVNQEAQQCEGPQLVIQGNQVALVGNMLTSEYNIDKKFITGLDLAPKKKK